MGQYLGLQVLLKVVLASPHILRKLFHNPNIQANYHNLKGSNDRFSMSVTQKNQSVFGNCLFFSFIKFVVDGIEDVQVKLVCSGR